MKISFNAGSFLGLQTFITGKKYSISKENFLGHSDIAPLRKKDPGEKFPWDFLSLKGVSIWYPKFKLKKKEIKSKAKRRIFFKNVHKIGYRFFNLSQKSKRDRKIVMAFQRRFLPKEVNGKITDKTLGLFGMGRIAQAMAQKAHFGFRMKIIFYDPYFNDEETIKKFNAVRCEDIDELFSNSDFVSLHCPSTKETKGIVNYETISKMKKTSYLINTARGDIVVEEDLVKALNKAPLLGPY